MNYFGNLLNAALGKGGLPPRKRFVGKASITAAGVRGWSPVGNVWPVPSDSFTVQDDRVLAACFSKSDIVYMCVNELASAICAAPLQVCFDGDDGKSEVVNNHSGLDLFYANSDYSYETIFRLIVERLSLTGASFNLLGLYQEVLGAGEFTPLPTHRVKRSMRGPMTLGYEFTRENGGRIPFKPEEICAICYPDPLNFGGYVSPLQAASRALNTDQQRADTTLQILKNKTLPGTYLVPDMNVTDAQKDKLVESFDLAVGSGTGSRGRTVMLPKGIHPEAGPDAKDVDFSVLNSLSETRICGVFQVPPIVIGAKVGLDMGANYASYEQARKSFYAETIMPLWAFIAGGLSRANILGNPELYFKFDTSGIKELQEDETAKITRGGLAYEKGIATLDEARALAGLPPFDGDGGAELKAPPPAPTFGQPFGGQPEPPSAGKSACVCGAKVGAIGVFPEEHALEGALRSIFGEQREVVLGQVMRGKLSAFDLSSWEPRMADACRPTLKRIWENRVKSTLARIAGRVRRKSSRVDMRAKAFTIGGSFDIVRREALELMEKQLREFAASVNLTTATNLDEAVKAVISTAEHNNTIPALRKAVSGVFTDATDARARVIAVTESSRANHDGGILAAAKSGVVRGFMPEVSSDACEVCLGKIGQYVPLAKAQEQIGSYDRDLPPWHPNDRCTYTEVLDIDEEPINANA